MVLLAQIITRLLVWAIAAPVHELSHALSAYRLGDSTAARQGRLTLNPLAHMDPIGTLLIAVAGFGWAKPTPVNPYYLRFGPRLGMVIVSVAGPLSNLLLAAVFAIPVRLGWVHLADFGFIGLLPTPAAFIYTAIDLNLLLLFFNLLPIAPLDGFAVLSGLLPEDLAYRFEQTRQWGMLVLFALVFLGAYGGGQSLLGEIVGPPIGFLRHMLTGQ